MSPLQSSKGSLDMPLSAEAVERVEKVGQTIPFPSTHVLCVTNALLLPRTSLPTVCASVVQTNVAVLDARSWHLTAWYRPRASVEDCRYFLESGSVPGLQMVGLLANIRHKAAGGASDAVEGDTRGGALAATIMLPALLPPAMVITLSLNHASCRKIA